MHHISGRLRVEWIVAYLLASLLDPRQDIIVGECSFHDDLLFLQADVVR